MALFKSSTIASAREFAKKRQDNSFVSTGFGVVMRRKIDWVSIEGRYRANKGSLREIASEFGVSEAGIRKRAKKEGWVRDPEGIKRQRVKAALSGAGSAQTGAQCAARTLGDETEQDVDDMRAGVEVARHCIARLLKFVLMTNDPKEVKVIADANKLAIETIRRIRGLDDPAVKIDVNRASDAELEALVKGRDR